VPAGYQGVDLIDPAVTVARMAAGVFEDDALAGRA
jgi:hypothetical protein